jgi:hypothetical protein
MVFHSSRARTKQYMLSSRRHLDVVRFSQMFQRSLQNLAGNGNTSPFVELTGLQPTHNHVQTHLVMATGVFAGKIIKVEHLVVEPAPIPLTGLVSDTTGASIPAVDISTFDTSNRSAESSHYSGTNHILNQSDDPLGFPWLPGELDSFELESDIMDWKTQLSEILFSLGLVPSTSALFSVSPRPTTPLYDRRTDIEALLSRFPGLTAMDLAKAINISSNTSYICCKCYNTQQPPPPRHTPLSACNQEQPHGFPNISKLTPQRSGLRCHCQNLSSDHRILFQRDVTKNTNNTVEKIMSLLRAIPEPREEIPSIITYAPRNHSDSFIPPLLSIGPPNAREGDIIMQFMDCDIAAVI